MKKLYSGVMYSSLNFTTLTKVSILFEIRTFTTLVVLIVVGQGMVKHIFEEFLLICNRGYVLVTCHVLLEFPTIRKQ